MNESKGPAGSGIGVVGLLGVAFVVLKLVGVIHWSWLLVLLPFWGGLALVIAVVLFVLMVSAIVAEVKR